MHTDFSLFMMADVHFQKDGHVNTHSISPLVPCTSGPMGVIYMMISNLFRAIRGIMSEALTGSRPSGVNAKQQKAW
jgi:hypothetical protein